MLECIVTKFGGSSLANDEQFRKVRSILELEPTRMYLIPSAPGKRYPTDEKVTDLLYSCYELASAGRRDILRGWHTNPCSAHSRSLCLPRSELTQYPPSGEDAEQ